MNSAFSLSLQALASRQAKWVLALVLVAILVLVAAIVAMSLAHGISFGAQPHIACGGAEGGCPGAPLG